MGDSRKRSTAMRPFSARSTRTPSRSSRWVVILAFVALSSASSTRQSFSAPGGMEAAAGAAGACMAARSSRCTENALPCPSSLRTEMRPPIRSTMALTIARPSPEPCVPCS